MASQSPILSAFVVKLYCSVTALKISVGIPATNPCISYKIKITSILITCVDLYVYIYLFTLVGTEFFYISNANYLCIIIFTIGSFTK